MWLHWVWGLGPGVYGVSGLPFARFGLVRFSGLGFLLLRLGRGVRRQGGWRDRGGRSRRKTVMWFAGLLDGLATLDVNLG